MKTATQIRELEDEKKRASYLYKQSLRNDSDFMLKALKHPLDRLLPDIAEASFYKGFEEGYKRREEHERLEQMTARLEDIPNLQDKVLAASRRIYGEVMANRLDDERVPEFLFLTKRKAMDLYPFLKTMINGWSLFDIVSEANIYEKLKGATLADAKICLTEDFSPGWRWA